MNCRSSSSVETKKFIIILSALLMLLVSFFTFSSHASFKPTVLLNTNFEVVASLYQQQNNLNAETEIDPQL
jgi:hypothetical protein